MVIVQDHHLHNNFSCVLSERAALWSKATHIMSDNEVQMDRGHDTGF